MKEQSANAERFSEYDASFLSDASFSFTDKTLVKQTEEEAAKLSRTAFRIVLGSRSPRRRQLLSDAGYRFAILPSEEGVEENAESTIDPNVSPCEYVSYLAGLKAKNVVERLASFVVDEFGEGFETFQNASKAPFVVVSCDSIAVCDGEILGKPDDIQDAERMLRKLSGSRHFVHTGLCVWKTETFDAPEFVVRRVETSTLVMEPLSEDRLSSYLASGLWEGKAGAFGYQDGNDWLQLLSGSGSNVVGLPMEALAWVLTRLPRN